MSHRSGRVFLAAAFLFFAAEGWCASEAKPAPARTLVDSAVAQAAAQKKVVFIHFSASW